MSVQARPLRSLAADLASGKTTSLELTENCLARIDDREGEGARAFIYVARDEALAAARAMDLLRKHHGAPSPFAGIPISIKDLFDVAGQVTAAGSRVLADAPKASADATAVATLRRAGFVLIGRTNMTEFAYSGLGLNPHYGTPLNAWDRKNQRIPGGSSSGAGVSVAAGMAHAALGTDTGGSIRIPAAFNGLTGFKPTARRVSLQGALPLSFSLDSAGPIARTLDCCALMDDVLTGCDQPPLRARATAAVEHMRFAVPKTLMLDNIDSAVSKSFSDALDRLSKCGAKIEDVACSEFGRIAEMNAKGGYSAAESYAWHKALLDAKGDGYDQRVRARILKGKDMSALDYLELEKARRSLIASVTQSLQSYDALLFPSVAIAPPRLADLEDDAAFGKINLLVLRNAAVVNLFDGCAISLPIHREGEAPVGLTLAGIAGGDDALLAAGAAVERCLSQK
jgi:aspartyl-tRNA(Asn)/glutamyl-tRNA(Gln) amidotransferase subunit A